MDGEMRMKMPGKKANRKMPGIKHGILDSTRGKSALLGMLGGMYQSGLMKNRQQKGTK
jgi:hypothetical protein